MYHYVFKFIIFIENFSDELNISTKSTLSILLTFAKIYYETLRYTCYTFTFNTEENISPEI